MKSFWSIDAALDFSCCTAAEFSCLIDNRRVTWLNGDLMFEHAEKAAPKLQPYAL